MVVVQANVADRAPGGKSGLHRKTVLEVVERANGNSVIASGFGGKSAWLYNITANPDIRVNWGRDSFDAVAQRVTGDEAFEIFSRYTDNHRTAAKTLQARLGLPLDDPRAASKLLPIFRLVRSS